MKSKVMYGVRILCLTAAVVTLLPRQSDAGILSFLADLFSGAARVVGVAAEVGAHAIPHSPGGTKLGPRLLALRGDTGLPQTYAASIKNRWFDPSAPNATRRHRTAATEALRQPQAGRPLTSVNMSDKRWPASKGWVKMEQRIAPPRNDLSAKFQNAVTPHKVVNHTVVHYNMNRFTGQLADPKVKPFSIYTPKRK